MGRAKSMAGEDQMNFGRVIHAWAADGQAHQNDIPELVAYHVEGFLFGVGRSLINIIGEASDTIALNERQKWILGSPIISHQNPPLVPIAAIGLERVPRQDQPKAHLRVALLSEQGASGWRFETGETQDQAPNRHHHAQAIHGWHRGSTCLIHPHTAADAAECTIGQVADAVDPPDDPDSTAATTHQIPTHCPAFPLRADTLTGLAVATLVALYGVPHARRILETDTDLVSASADPSSDICQLLLAPL